jgi:hypothetical protein
VKNDEELNSNNNYLGIAVSKTSGMQKFIEHNSKSKEKC